MEHASQPAPTLPGLPRGGPEDRPDAGPAAALPGPPVPPYLRRAEPEPPAAPPRPLRWRGVRLVIRTRARRRRGLQGSPARALGRRIGDAVRARLATLPPEPERAAPAPAAATPPPERAGLPPAGAGAWAEADPLGLGGWTEAADPPVDEWDPEALLEHAPEPVQVPCARAGEERPRAAALPATPLAPGPAAEDVAARARLPLVPSATPQPSRATPASAAEVPTPSRRAVALGEVEVVWRRLPAEPSPSSPTVQGAPEGPRPNATSDPGPPVVLGRPAAEPTPPDEAGTAGPDVDPLVGTPPAPAGRELASSLQQRLELPVLPLLTGRSGAMPGPSPARPPRAPAPAAGEPATPEARTAPPTTAPAPKPEAAIRSTADLMIRRPPWGARLTRPLARWVRTAGRALAWRPSRSVRAGLVAVAAAPLPAALALALPPLATPASAGAAAILSLGGRRRSRDLRLLLASAATAGALAQLTLWRLAGPPAAWPAGWAALGPTAGLALALLVGWRLPRKGRAIAALAGAGLALEAATAAGGTPEAILTVGAAAVAVTASLSRWQPRQAARQELALRVWACLGTAGILGCAIVLSATARTVAAGAGLAGLSLGALAGILLARSGAADRRATDDGRTAGWFPAAAAATAMVAAGLALATVGAAAGLSLAGAVTLSLLAPLVVQAAAWRRRLAWATRDAEGAGPSELARWGAAAGFALVALALLGPLLGGGHPAWNVGAAALLLLAGFLGMERALGGGPAWALLSPAAAVSAGAVTLVAGGLSPAWLPAVLAVVAASLLGLGERLPGRTRRADWEGPLLGIAVLCSLGSLAALALGAARPATLGAGAALLAGGLLGRRGALARRALPLLAGAAVVAAAVALGAGAWALPGLSLTALGWWVVLRRGQGELAPGVLLLAAVVIAGAPLAAVAAAWVPAVAALVGIALLAGLEVRSAARRNAIEGAAPAFVAVSATCLAATVALAARSGRDLPLALLGGALLAAVVGRLITDRRLALALRAWSRIGWLAAVLAGLDQAAGDAGRGATLLAAAAGAALLVAVVGRERWLAFAAGLVAATATGLVSLSAGLPLVDHPLLYLAPSACWMAAWGVLEASSGRPANAHLLAGLGLLFASAALQAVLDQTPGLRAASAVAAAACVAAGWLTRCRVPVLVGGLALAWEAAWLGAATVATVRAEPSLLLGALLGLAAIGIAAWRRFLGRPGGLAAARMAWQADWLRLREGWDRWS